MSSEPGGRWRRVQSPQARPDSLAWTGVTLGGGPGDEGHAPGAREPDPDQPVSDGHVGDETRAGGHGRKLGGMRKRAPELVHLLCRALQFLKAAAVREAGAQ